MKVEILRIQLKKNKQKTTNTQFRLVSYAYADYALQIINNQSRLCKYRQ